MHSALSVVVIVVLFGAGLILLARGPRLLGGQRRAPPPRGSRSSRATASARPACSSFFRSSSGSGSDGRFAPFCSLSRPVHCSSASAPCRWPTAMRESPEARRKAARRGEDAGHCWFYPNGDAVYREQDPGSFWLSVILRGGAGATPVLAPILLPLFDTVKK